MKYIKNAIHKYLNNDSILIEAVYNAYQICFESPSFRTNTGEIGDIYADRALSLYGEELGTAYITKTEESIQNNEPIMVPSELVPPGKNDIITTIQAPQDQIMHPSQLQDQLQNILDEIRRENSVKFPPNKLKPYIH